MRVSLDIKQQTAKRGQCFVSRFVPSMPKPPVEKVPPTGFHVRFQRDTKLPVVGWPQSSVRLAAVGIAKLSIPFDHQGGKMAFVVHLSFLSVAGCSFPKCS